ncbi:hypothetical protein DFH29DRAFT_147458 [Suillus ampliporus]|nr:hypothetical protein DFH29DRAFT_147458 [Suillus ampliporus]
MSIHPSRKVKYSKGTKHPIFIQVKIIHDPSSPVVYSVSCFIVLEEDQTLDLRMEVTDPGLFGLGVRHSPKLARNLSSSLQFKNAYAADPSRAAWDANFGLVLPQEDPWSLPRDDPEQERSVYCLTPILLPDSAGMVDSSLLGGYYEQVLSQRLRASVYPSGATQKTRTEATTARPYL